MLPQIKADIKSITSVFQLVENDWLNYHMIEKYQ